MCDHWQYTTFSDALWDTSSGLHSKYQCWLLHSPNHQWQQWPQHTAVTTPISSSVSFTAVLMGSTKLASPLATSLMSFMFPRQMFVQFHVFTSVNNLTSASTCAFKGAHLFVQSHVNWREWEIDQRHYSRFKAVDFTRQQGQKKAQLPSNKQSVKPIFRTVIPPPTENTLSKPDNTHLTLLVTTSQQQLAILDRPDWQLVRPGLPWLTAGPPACSVTPETELLVTFDFFNQQPVVHFMGVFFFSEASAEVLLQSAGRRW